MPHRTQSEEVLRRTHSALARVRRSSARRPGDPMPGDPTSGAAGRPEAEVEAEAVAVEVQLEVSRRSISEMSPRLRGGGRATAEVVEPEELLALGRTRSAFARAGRGLERAQSKLRGLLPTARKTARPLIPSHSAAR